MSEIHCCGKCEKKLDENHYCKDCDMHWCPFITIPVKKKV